MMATTTGWAVMVGRLIENRRESAGGRRAGAAHEHAAVPHRLQNAIDTQTGMEVRGGPRSRVLGVGERMIPVAAAEGGEGVAAA